jgi:hypothetical protein
LQHLYRLANKRSRLLPDGNTVLDLEHQKEWFDDYIATIESLSSLAIFAPQEFERTIAIHATGFRTEFESLLRPQEQSGRKALDVSNLIRLTKDLEYELMNAAKRDLRLTRS